MRPERERGKEPWRGTVQACPGTNPRPVMKNSYTFDKTLIKCGKGVVKAVL